MTGGTIIDASPFVSDIENNIGVKRGFFENLLTEDDWSFILKLHAFIEAVCTHLLLFHFKEPELDDVLRRLELSNKSFGKTKFLEKLGLINKEYRRYIAALSELRNSLVHDIRNSEFSLNELVEKYDAPKLKSFSIAFSPYETILRNLASKKIGGMLELKLNAQLEEQIKIQNVIDRALRDPKSHVWIGAHNLLAEIRDSYGYSDYRNSIKFE